MDDFIASQTFKNMRDAEYSSSRGGRECASSDLIKQFSKRIQEQERILILGCNSGRYDLFPLVENLLEKGGVYSIVGIDESESLNDAIEILKKRCPSNYTQNNNIFSCSIESLSIELINDDIELYSKDCFDKSRPFNKIICFFVLHHLTNWLKCLDILEDILVVGGELCLSELHDPIIQSIENKKIVNANKVLTDLCGLIIKFHEERFKKFGVLYAGNTLGTDSEAIENTMYSSFNLETVLSSPFANSINLAALVEKITSTANHAPLFWGQKIDANNQFELHSDYKEFLARFVREIDEKKVESVCYESEMIARVFKKRPEETCRLQSDKKWECNFHSFYSQFDSSLAAAPTGHEDILMLQLALLNQAFIRETLFISTLFWRLVRKGDSFGVETNVENMPFHTLLTSREFPNILDVYYNHILHFQKSPMSRILFDSFKNQINWIFAATEGDFECEIIDNGIMRFVVFMIPKRYRKKNPVMVKSQKGDLTRFANFVFGSMTEIRAVDNNQEPDLIDRYEIEKDSVNRVKKIKKLVAANVKKWHSISKVEEDLVVNEFAEKIPGYSFLNNYGTCIYITNRLYEDKRPGRIVSNGGFFICEKNVDLNELRIKNSALSLRYNFIHEIIDIYSRRILVPAISNDLRMALEEGEKHARKAAIASVMARNMSHNIGSHVLAKLIDSQQIAEIHEDSDNQCKSRPPYHEKTLSKDELIARFNLYIKTRMDYLADIATSTPVMQTDKWIYREAIADFLKNRVLLNYISGVNDFEYTVKVHVVNGDTDITQDDVLASFPNDVLGCHSLYVIIENLIRNTAKHSSVKGDNVEIILQVSECLCDDSLLEVVLYDNVSLDVDLQLSDAEKATFIDKYVEEPTKRIDWLVLRQNRFLDSNIIESDTRGLRNHSWGMIEMLSAAAYLRKISADEIGHEKFNIQFYGRMCDGVGNYFNIPNILRAVKVEDKYLGYKFHLLKPSNFLIISNSFDKKNNEELRKYGILLMSNAEFLNTKKDISSFQFLFYENSPEVEVLISHKECLLPSRKVQILETDVNKIISVFASGDREEIYNCLWGIWTNQLMVERGIKKISCGPRLSSGKAIFNEIDLPTGSVYDAMICYHGESWSEVSQKGGGDFYAEPVSSVGRSRLPIFSVQNNALAFHSNKELFRRYQLCEALLLRVGIVDERIQSAAETMYYNAALMDTSKEVNILLSDIYRHTKIRVPSVEYDGDLNKTDYHLGKTVEHHSVKYKLEQWFEDNVNELDAIVIHLGVIEKLINTTSKDKKAVESYIQKNISRHKRCGNLIIIITSGRGKPHNLPDNMRFVNFSSLMDCMVNDRSKYKLTNLIYSARKSRR